MAGAFITDDLSAFFSNADFAVEASYFEGGSTITGIYDDDEIEVDRGDGQTHMIRATRFHTKSSHGVKDGHTLTVSGVRYTVAFQQDDGTGTTVLYLEKR